MLVHLHPTCECEVAEYRAAQHVEQDVLSSDRARIRLEEKEKDILDEEALISRSRGESTGVAGVEVLSHHGLFCRLLLLSRRAP